MKFNEFVKATNKLLKVSYPDREVIGDTKDGERILVVKKNHWYGKDTLLNEYNVNFHLGYVPMLSISGYDREVLGINEVKEVYDSIDALIDRETEKLEVTAETIMSKLSDYDFIKDKIYYSLINTNRNGELLEKVTHRRYGFSDMSIIYKIMVDSEDVKENGYIFITNEIRQEMNLMEQDLFELAEMNTPKLFPPEYCNFEELFELLGKPLDKQYKGKLSNMFHLFSPYSVDYASVILYPGFWNKVASDRGVSGLYILLDYRDTVFAFETNGENEDIKNKLVLSHKKSIEKAGEHEVLSECLYYFDAISSSIKIVEI